MDVGSVPKRREREGAGFTACLTPYSATTAPPTTPKHLLLNAQNKKTRQSFLIFLILRISYQLIRHITISCRVFPSHCVYLTGSGMK